MFAKCFECDQEQYELNGVCDDCLRRMHKLELDNIISMCKPSHKAGEITVNSVELSNATLADVEFAAKKLCGDNSVDFDPSKICVGISFTGYVAKVLIWLPNW